MANNDRAQRIDGDEVLDLPFPRDGDGADNHHGRHAEAEDEGKLKALEESRDFFEKRDIFDFFGRGAPCHVDFEEMAEK
jgi:hypothetical protein